MEGNVLGTYLHIHIVCKLSKSPYISDKDKQMFMNHFIPLFLKIVNVFVFICTRLCNNFDMINYCTSKSK